MPCLFFHVAKQLDKKDKVNLKSYDVTAWLANSIHIIHILPNVLWNKGNQTLKFGQLIECNMINIFLEKSCARCDGETSPRPFSERLKLSISLDQYSKVCYSAFIVSQVEGHWNILTLSCRPLFFYLILSFS